MRGISAMRVLAVAVAVASTVLAMSACAPGVPSLDLVTRLNPEWTVAAHLVGAPAITDGVVVSYVDSGDDQLEVVAWAVESGAELWRDSAVFGSIPGYGTGSVVIADVGAARVATFLQDDPADENGWQRVAAVELKSGRHVDDGNLVIDAISLPRECANGPGICLRGRPQAQWARPSQLLRADLTAGTLVAEQGPEVPDDSRSLGTHVYSTLDREPDGVELLGYGEDGIVLWERPYTEVFDAGYSSDGGWSWFDDDSHNLVIGTGNPYDPAVDGEPITHSDLTERMIVALDPGSGRTVWKVTAATRWCDAAEIDDALITSIIPVCIFESGTITIDRSNTDDPTLSSNDIDTRIVGLDAATGKETWSIDAGGDQSVFHTWTSKFRSQIATRPVSFDGEIRLVDALTGHMSPLPDDARLVCESERDAYAAYAPGRVATATERSKYSAGLGAFACDGAGRAVDDDALSPGALSPGALEMGATETDDGWFIVDGLESLSGFRTVTPR